MAMHSGSALAAVACDDRVLRLYDIEAGGRLVRRFKGHKWVVGRWHHSHVSCGIQLVGVTSSTIITSAQLVY